MEKYNIIFNQLKCFSFMIWEVINQSLGFVTLFFHIIVGNQRYVKFTMGCTILVREYYLIMF